MITTGSMGNVVGKKFTKIGSKMFVYVKGGVWIYELGDWCSRRFIANSWYADINIQNL